MFKASNIVSIEIWKHKIDALNKKNELQKFWGENKGGLRRGRHQIHYCPTLHFQSWAMTVSKDLLHQNFLLQRDCSIKKFGCHFNCNKNLTLWISLICGSYKLWEDGLLKTFYKIIFPLVRTIFLAFYVAIMHAVI